jgi:hypothetical protein
MLNKPTILEKDENSLFLRNKIMEIHLKKLKDIKNRKAAPNVENFVRKRCLSQEKFDWTHNYFIERDNKYLGMKINTIFSRNKVNLSIT